MILKEWKCEMEMENGEMRRIWKYVFINRNGRMNGNIMNIRTTIESISENENSVFHLLNYFDKL